MMSDRSRATLVEARRLLAEVTDDIEVTSSRCGSCGLTAYDDWEAKQVRDGLEGALAKIDRALDAPMFGGDRPFGPGARGERMEVHVERRGEPGAGAGRSGR